MDDVLAIIVAVFVVFGAIFGAGFVCGQTGLRREAIKAGVARYVPAEDGAPKFTWLTNNIPVVK